MVQATVHQQTHRSPDAPDPPTSERSLGALLSRMWPLFVTSWVVFVIINPVATMLDASDTVLETLASLAWAIAFLAGYLRLVLHKPFRTEVTVHERRIQIALLVLLTILVLYVDIAFPTGFFWLFIYVNLAAGVLLPARGAAWFIVAITLLGVGVEVARAEWAQAMAVPGIAVWGISTMMLRRLIHTVDELRMAREELARMAVARERLRFGRDLHDLLGHSLSLIALKSELAGRLVESHDEQAAAEIGDVEQVARRALRDVREAVTGYRRATLGEELAGARQMLVAAGIETRIDVATGTLPPPVDTVLAWTVREGTTNVIRHSRASTCQIRMACDDDVVRVDVIDDGRGRQATVEPSDDGCGLTGLAERVASSGGRMVSGPAENGGFRLRVELPITAAIGQSTLAASPTANGMGQP